MNIFEQEDLIKGLPDESLMKEAQSPSGPLPQYLIVSEIQRRQDMRKRFSQQGEQSPQGTVKDQILSGGIAELGSQPPMGQPPQMGQPPMGQPQQMGLPPQMGMPPQMGQPPMGPPPPMGQLPMGMPPQMSMQQPMGMAAGGVVRMAGGQDAPFTSPYLQDLAAYNQEAAPMGQQIGDLERAALQLKGDQRNAARRQSLGIQDQVGDLYGSTLGDYSQDDRLETLLAMASPDEIKNKIGELGLNPNFMSGVVGDLSEPDDATSQLQNLASRYPDSTSLTSQLENLASRYPDSIAAKELMGTNPGISYAPFKSLITNVENNNATKEDTARVMFPSSTNLDTPTFQAAVDKSSPEIKVNADQSKLFQPKGSTIEELSASIFNAELPYTKGLEGYFNRRIDPKTLRETKREMYKRILGENVPSAFSSPFRADERARIQFDKYIERTGALDQYLNNGVAEVPANTNAVEDVVQPAPNVAVEQKGPWFGGDLPNFSKLEERSGVLETKDPSGFAAVSEGLRGLQNKSVVPIDYSKAQEKINEVESIAENLRNSTSTGYIEMLNKLSGERPSTDYSSFAPDYEGLITESERRVRKIKEDAKKDAGAQALIQLGAGIAEGNVSEGLRGASRVSSDIMKEARAESSAENSLARRMEMVSKEAQMNMGVKGREAAVANYNKKLDAVTADYADQRQREFQAAGMDSDAAFARANFEAQIAKAINAASEAERDRQLQNLIAQATVERYKEITKNSERDLTAAQLRLYVKPIDEAMKQWTYENPEHSPAEWNAALRKFTQGILNTEDIADTSSGQPKTKSRFDEVDSKLLIPTA